jgi:hypothetical protein
VSAVAAASAAAAPEFDAAKYPVKVEGTSTNNQAWGSGAGTSLCKKAAFSTEEEGIGNPAKNSPTLEVHPHYSECVFSRSVSGGPAEVVTTGCNYVFHAVKPAELKGTTDIKCASATVTVAQVTEQSKIIKGFPTGNLKAYEIVTGTKIPTSPEAAKKTWIEKIINATEFEISNPVEGAGTATVKEAVTVQKDIQIKPTIVTGCVIFLPAQAGLGFQEYKTEPANEVTFGAEVEKIQTGIAPACGFGEIGTLSEYREGEEDAKTEIAKLAPKGNPAKLQAKGTFGVEADPIEVALNEAHWYKNRVLIPASGEGVKVMIWGTVTLAQTSGAIGGTCQSVWGGNVINSQGGGPSAVAGETKIAGFSAYDCNESTVCETTDESKLFVEPEGLGVGVEGGKAVGREWSGSLSGTAPVVNLGTGAEATQIKWHVLCPKTTATTGEYNKSWTGELKTTEVVPGTAQGYNPTEWHFAPPTSGELKVGGVEKEGKVTTKLKVMGFEGGEIITTKNP